MGNLVNLCALIVQRASTQTKQVCGKYENHNSPDLSRDITNCKKCPKGTYGDQSQRSVLATGCKVALLVSSKSF